MHRSLTIARAGSSSEKPFSVRGSMRGIGRKYLAALPASVWFVDVPRAIGPVSRQDTPDELARFLGHFVSSVGEGDQQEPGQVRVGPSCLAYVGEPLGEKLGGRGLAPDGALHQAERKASELSICAHRDSMAVRGSCWLPCGGVDQAAVESIACSISFARSPRRRPPRRAGLNRSGCV